MIIIHNYIQTAEHWTTGIWNYLKNLVQEHAASRSTSELLMSHLKPKASGELF